MRKRIPIVSMVLASLSCGPAMAAGRQRKATPIPPVTHQASSSDLARFRLMPGFRVKPSDITLPEGLPAGQYRRIFQPFPNWTLVCDENLQKKQKICNVARTIQGPDGGTVFSWSLAAAQDGQPIFILRVPTNVGMGGLIRLVLPDGGAPVPIAVQGCNPTICLAYQSVSQRLRTAVEQGVTVEISYGSGSPPKPVRFFAPLAGLAAALAAI
ncbi:invasion protein IalB [Sphingomonas yabuuchiae]|uniref:Invasion protein IalB n=3 Tax=Sphingomonas yabuuchiae TaxID=172044 RepID=A0ABR6KEJ4_9SPHN|nr:invasion protein IalB [Sphingomonas yabuuchiae]